MSVNVTRKQSNAFTGELYVLNSAITLVSNIMDTPTTMWEENESLTLLYKAIRKYLQMGRRLEIVEERFNVMDEVCSYVKEDINNYVEVNLYWWVIILLAVDALVMVIETNLDFLD
ncbi:hypothetical protein SARC_04019 [Sphaeroforma arctica JP610]|uniref:DUF155 domain-containing protein n=1 Tax=Sphaeroforma arctica JP610 TaxID=667725 RepID=A0A0L0G4K6_9EUKA|nr:hypothetical protein SARC_04019 [Sphaeroforma arctica JP610]KNC83741.1 hypothetical protein SARC_04019 [Sphaeroforma arctica JP610]|eukprot:XP_014157643.1 hypothetical protein SARC_04019 [Sphaeroforma arctica JP610]